MDYEKYKIKNYNYWGLYLHPQQGPYLGRSYAWAKNVNAAEMKDMTREERDELFDKLIPDWEKAVKTLFQADKTNFTMLANDAVHLHWHLVPRYERPREFMGIEFKDVRYGHNYSPYEHRDLRDEVLLAIRDAIINEID